MEKEYTVIANTREDLPALEAEITASSGAGPIPNRSVDVANPRPGSKIQTHFMLTDAEAEELRKDPRVRAVEIPPEQRDDIVLGLHGFQNGVWFRDSGVSSSYVNWGLRRCIEVDNAIYTDGTGAAQTLADGPYQYAVNGEGVDVVIQDSGIDPNHPEWNDSSGSSRLQQIDWYTASGLTGTQSVDHYGDYDGHGTHVASTAAGLLYGWAKGAEIYSQKLNGLEGPGDPGTGISMSDAFDTIRLWHLDKTNPASLNYTGRPTVVNMSWGYSAYIYGDPASGVYRGTPWTWGVDYSSRTTLLEQTGVMRPLYNNNSGTFFIMPVRVASVDAEIEDMILDGVHVCIAAGNSWHKADVSTGPDFNNQVTFGATTRNYHQGSSPYSDNAFMVGNVSSYYYRYAEVTYPPGSDTLDTSAATSVKGPGVNIWAPGSAIVAATSNNNDGYTTTQYPLDPSYVITSISGTSMASPQVCGVVACHLQVKPDLTPAQMQQRIWNDSKATLYDSGSATDYDRYLDSIMGSENRMLYNKYGRQPVTVENDLIITQIQVG